MVQRTSEIAFNANFQIANVNLSRDISMDYALLFLLLFIFTIKLKDFFSKSLYLVLRFYYDFAMFLPVYLRILPFYLRILPVYLRILPVYLRIFHSGDLWCYLLLT